ncbi:MAG: A/G-specific adenine glycosylase [Porphyromonadaceae bacterium]|nr:A/G-specific adenine glycosylase [Porphyromonadaceae bacterium]
MPNKKDFAFRIERWFEENRRPLPWRETADPYRIWVSEIILQQTRVAQGLEYYYRFIDRFPTVRSLAEADEDEVLKYWEGLGYYSRARNLHAAARQVMGQFGGEIPDSYEGIRSLKGVGDYTAAAIASFAYGLPCAVVDGNVYRVLSRFFAVDTPIDTTEGHKLFAALADEMLDRQAPALYNQAIMELGALQCLPRSPQCVACPLFLLCEAAAAGKAESFPVKAGKTVVRPRYFNYLVLHCGEDVFLSRRSEKDIWRNLYEFVLIESNRALTFEALQQTEAYRSLLGEAGRVQVVRPPFSHRHLLSHRVIHATFHTLEIEKVPESLSPYIRLKQGELGRYAFARLTGLYFDWLASSASSFPRLFE